MLIPFTKLMQCAFIVATLNALSLDVACAQEPATRPALTVTIQTVNSVQIIPGFGATGNIRAWHDASVSAQTNGLRLKALHADVGDRVKAGQILAEFEDTASRGDLTQAEARLRQAQASLDTAKRNADRIRKIRGSGAISQSEVDQALSGEKNALADVTAARAALQTQTQRSSYTRLLAPSDGVISVRNAVIGAVVNPGQEIFHLVVDNRLEWQAQLSMRNLMQVSAGMPVQVVLPNDRKVAGRVRQIGPTLDEQTRQGIVYVDLAADPQLRAGMFLRGRFELPAKQGLTIPRESLVLRDGFHFVFVLGNDNKVAQTKVQIGGAADNKIEVTAGLRDGDRVVTQGAAFLNDQDTVRVVPATAPPPAESSPGAASHASPAGS
ncbi:MAG TPA: efflux RND transporter periplasmic adaptor subunit [Advenella sp.]|nr:efflux RND transporter periplasmic adaptor subunit [Advenella sp.]